MKTSSKIIGGCCAAALVLSAMLAFAYLIEPNRLVVNRQEVTIDGLDPEFDGMKFVVISDIHGGSNGADAQKLRRVVDLANAQNADAMFLLGDFVSQQRGLGSPINERPLRMPVGEIADAIVSLTAKHGVFAVLGNHDGWYGNANVEGELERVGIRVLDDDVALIERNGKQLRILGLRDHLRIDDWKRISDEAKALLAPSEGTGNVIVLEHSPDVLPMITGDLLISNDLKLMFSGHTHGGQVWLPILGYPVVPSSYGQKYAAGHVKDAGLDLFVTTGVGTSILPFRFMVPPEIAVVTIRTRDQ